jgi:RNA polymerase sigma-70 factor (ECF subfamily)
MDAMTNMKSDAAVEPQITDAELIRQFRAGQRKAFDQLVLRHQRKVYAITFRMTSNHDDADDLAQEVFLAAYHAIERFDENQSFIAYLSRIAINLSINHLRRKKRWLNITSRRRDETGREIMGAKDTGPQQQLEQRELMDRLSSAIQSLPPHQKAVLILKVYHEMSYEDIASALKISIGTVMSRLHRARNKLRTQLHDLC